MTTKFEMQIERDKITVTYVEYENRAMMQMFNDYTAVTDPMNTVVMLTVEQVQDLIDKLTQLKQVMKA